MDDELQQLEAELKRLRPVAPSPELFRRVTSDLAPASRCERRANIPWLWAAVLPAAAAAVAIIFLPIARHDPTPQIEPATPPKVAATAATVMTSGEVLKPVAVENVLYSAQDEGLVTLDDGTPARRERLNYVDTITWKNPRTNASLTWQVPREEVRVVPVSFQ
ncbi:MAG: hypothetical protein HY736_09860 [Verrucomicrobia bacterium]|nr:hypothetical protein [Verrucomicrobiota bacterium]